MATPFPKLSTSATELLRTRLSEAVAWCLSRISASDAKCSTRSKALEPSRQFTMAHGERFTDRFTYDRTTSEQRRSLVDEVCANRARCLREASEAPAIPVGPHLAGGRLFSSSIDGSDWSELPTVESEGFLDSFDIPGWDTWLWIYPEIYAGKAIGDCVLCWIPPQIIPLLQRAIQVSPMDSLWWMDYSEVFFR
jgi:hypothetical protein